jgi:hypothetical protein
MVTDVKTGTVNGTPLLAMLPTVTTTLPVVAPAGTVADMLLALHEEVDAVTPLNFTVLVPLVAPKFAPAMVTVVPGKPEFGVSCVIVERRQR